MMKPCPPYRGETALARFESKACEITCNLRADSMAVLMAVIDRNRSGVSHFQRKCKTNP